MSGMPARIAMREFDVSLNHCSVLASEDAIFHCRDGVSGDFHVDYCVLARVDGKGVSSPATALLRQDGVASGHLGYSGANNVYFSLSPLLRPRAGFRSRGHGREHRRVSQAPGVRTINRKLARSPWQDPDPIKSIDSGFVRRGAFRINPTLAELRQAQYPKRPLGVERCSWGDVYDRHFLPWKSQPGLSIPPRARDEKIVDPSLVTPQEGYYRTLRQAIEDSSDKDVILIKHNGPLPVDSVRLERSSLDITIRPYKGFKPILKLGNTTDSDAAAIPAF